MKLKPEAARRINREIRLLRLRKRNIPAGPAREKFWVALCTLAEMKDSPTRPGLAERAAMNVIRARGAAA